jgi:hypothetical protein
MFLIEGNTSSHKSATLLENFQRKNIEKNVSVLEYRRELAVGH